MQPFASAWWPAVGEPSNANAVGNEADDTSWYGIQMMAQWKVRQTHLSVNEVVAKHGGAAEPGDR